MFSYQAAGPQYNSSGTCNSLYQQHPYAHGHPGRSLLHRCKQSHCFDSGRMLHKIALTLLLSWFACTTLLAVLTDHPSLLTFRYAVDREHLILQAFRILSASCAIVVNGLLDSCSTMHCLTSARTCLLILGCWLYMRIMVQKGLRPIHTIPPTASQPQEQLPTASSATTLTAAQHQPAAINNSSQDAPRRSADHLPFIMQAVFKEACHHYYNGNIQACFRMLGELQQAVPGCNVQLSPQKHMLDCILELLEAQPKTNPPQPPPATAAPINTAATANVVPDDDIVDAELDQLCPTAEDPAAVAANVMNLQAGFQASLLDNMVAAELNHGGATPQQVQAAVANNSSPAATAFRAHAQQLAARTTALQLRNQPAAVRTTINKTTTVQPQPETQTALGKHRRLEQQDTPKRKQTNKKQRTAAARGAEQVPSPVVRAAVVNHTQQQQHTATSIQQQSSKQVLWVEFVDQDHIKYHAGNDGQIWVTKSRAEATELTDQLEKQAKLQCFVEHVYESQTATTPCTVQHWMLNWETCWYTVFKKDKQSKQEAATDARICFRQRLARTIKGGHIKLCFWKDDGKIKELSLKDADAIHRRQHTV